MNKTNTRKALNPAYRKHKPLRKDVTNFITQLKWCIDAVKLSDDRAESEEHIKSHFKDFFTSTFYSENYINTKDRIDLAIYLDSTVKSDIGVIIEAKKPSNKSEFLTEHDLNRKALQELLLYYLRERVDNGNNNIKHLIATNGYEWFLFKAEDFYNIFYKNKELIKEYKLFRDGLKDTSKNELFYNEIAKKYIAEIEEVLPFVHLDFSKTNFEKLSDAHLNTLYKIFSNVHLLGHSFGNDGNQLNKSFYNELLHIIGLEEVKDKGKKVISRKPEKERDYASLLENAIYHLEDRDYLPRVKSVENSPEKAFNVGLELCLGWINRILFLKLLESQLLAYHKNDPKYKFLNSKFVKDYDELNDLFFSALAKQEDERHPKYKDKYKDIPYLNSSLFERNTLESEAFEISALSNDQCKVYSNTILKDASGKREKGKLPTLEYLFRFLDAYDFATDGNEGIEDAQEAKSLINASVLGLIFEKINGYKEGSFYTPAYITMYMCRETLRRTVVQKFKEQENDQIEAFDDLKSYCHRYFKTDDLKRFNGIVNSLRVCDPAVGSGHFLVSALNELIVIKNELGILVDAKGLPLRCDIEIVNDELYVIDDNGLLFEYIPTDKESTRTQHTLFHEKQTLIENCLFGVDINPNSVKICRLRLWIELLKNAYYTNENRLQTLPNIDINIKTGNSLISRFNLDDDLKDAFKGKEVNYSFKDYRNAVAEYKETNNKERKREVLEIINEVKHNFTSSLDNTFISKFQKAQGAYINEEERLKNLKAFGEKIKKSEKDELKRLKEKAEATYLEKEEIVNNAIYHNAFEWRFEFPEVLAEDGSYIGFDAVIGNPPYGVKLDLKEIDYYRNSYDFIIGHVEIYYLFTELALKRILFKDRELTYIIPNAWFSNKYARKYRQSILDNYKILNLINLNNKNVFEEASVETCIISIKKSFVVDNYLVKVGTDVTEESQYEFDVDRWSGNNNLIFFAENPIINTLIDKVNNAPYKIDDVLDVSNGIKPYQKGYGLNLNGEKLNDEDVKNKIYHSKTKLNEVYKREIKGKHIKNFQTLKGDMYIKWGKWLMSPKGIRYFENDKILMRQIIGKTLISSIDYDKQYADQSLYILIKKEETIGSLEYYLSILNSRLYGFYFRNYFSEDDALFPKIKVNELKSLPIIVLPENHQVRFKEKVVEIISLKNEDPQAETESLEREVDQMVYELYGLTQEEIAIVENS
ncbi:type IIG restriction enzyme/methyltransferase [Gelidibacter maritimus]|uniref:site-specific DNA-methyltransferase (adenine-specific) n=1 Tax=Gelidibacter maritimus TaxID=2761487 RepID=A0A7W2M773_9FLAO|nr:TaqI-like C-terminal specificity domain-containing protein [Gelidibacter maritimus]MBA6153948.1 Eco57I restriction-modification methylase domain-containing protein [Gelidibacter maritimus]